MSKLSFRARALDPSKPMPIYLAEELPDLPEYSAINRAVPQMPSGMEKEEESEHHLQRAICTGLIIPTPEVFLTEQEAYDRNYSPTYKMPRQLIHMQPLGLEQDIPDYDMDSADEMWVNSQPKRLSLSPLKFEQMMDRLEKSSGQTVVTLNEAKALLKEDDEISIAVYDYWLNKRLKTQHPLILSVKTENRSGAAANNPYLAFRRRTEKMQTRKNRKNDEASYEKMLKLRRDLSRAVTLLDMIKRREKTKREQVHLTIEIFEKRFTARDFSGALLSELSSNIKTSRPAFTPLYPSQYSHHSPMSQSGIMPSSSASHHYSTQQYLNSSGVGGLSSVGAIKRELDSGSRKEKRQYKKRKHKIQKEKQYSIQSASPAPMESNIESEDEDPGSNHMGGGSEGEEEGIYAFKRNKNCEYHKPLTKELGNWPWESKKENGLADPKYRYTLTSICHPRRRCIGYARRRLGRGGRVILDRVYSNIDDYWSQLDYTVFDSKKSSSPEKLNDNENLCRDPLYLSSSTEPIKHSNKLWNNEYRNNSSPPTVTDIYDNKGLNNNNNISRNIENNSISNISDYLLNNEIKREQLDTDNVDWTPITSSLNVHQQQQPNQSQSDVVVDLVRMHCKNNINNRNLSNTSNFTTDYMRTNTNINEKVNVIKSENLSIVKQENDSTDLNILDDENMNLARLSSFINATKTSTVTETVDCEINNVKSELSRVENFGFGTSETHGNTNYNVNNCNNKLIRSSSLPQNMNDIVKSEEKRTENDCVNEFNDIMSKELLDDIKKNWLHFRPKTPENILASSASNCSVDNEPAFEFTEQTQIIVEIQNLGSSPPSSVFSNNYGNETTFVTYPFAFTDLQADDQLMSTANTTDSSNSGIDFNLSGDSLNELNLSLGEEDNENILDNILQECQIDDIKTLNQTTNFWNGILDDGGLLDVIDDKKPPIVDAKDRIGYASEFLINGCNLPDERDNKKSGKRKCSSRSRIGSSTFTIVDSSKEEKFFRKEEPKDELNQSQKNEPPEEILAPPPQVPVSASQQTPNKSVDYHGNSIQLTKTTSIPVGSTNHATLISTNPSKIIIKQDVDQVPTTINQHQNAIITLGNVKLENDINTSGMITHPSGNAIADTGGGNMTVTAQQTPIILTPKQQQSHILVQQITQNSPAQIIVSNANLSVNDGSGSIVIAGNSTSRRQINGPPDRNAIQNILKQTKFINRKFHISQQQQIQTIKQEDDSVPSGSSKPATAHQIQPSGNYIKMSPYPVVVSELNVQQQNSLPASAVAVASNHNYSLQSSGQQITIIGQQHQGNKIILNTSGPATSVSGSGNLTIPIQDLQNKIHYNQIPTSNIKVNLVTSSGIQQGSLVVDPKNSEIVKATTAQQTHAMASQQHQQQQRVKLEKAINMYIDPDQKRVLYTKLINLTSLQKNSGQTQTVQVSPGTTQILNKGHTVQRLANAQAIVTNMRALPVSNQVVASTGSGVSTIVGGTSTDIGHKQQNSNSTDSLSGTTVSGGINLNTTNR